MRISPNIIGRSHPKHSLETVFSVESLRVRLAQSHFSTKDPVRRVSLRFKAQRLADIPVVNALVASYLDQIVSSMHKLNPKNIIKVSYRKDQDTSQHYIGIFTLDLARVSVDLSLIKDAALRKEVKDKLAKLSLSIETTPFFVPDDNIDLTSDMGLISFVSEAENLEAALAKLREPQNKILNHLADELETKLAKPAFLRTQFLKASETLLMKMLGKIF